MTDLDFPHFAQPVRFASGSYALCDEDTDEDVLGCVQRCLETPLGFADDEPEFGLREQVFRQGGADLDAIAAAVEDWEPRVTDRIARNPVLLAQLLDRVTVAVSPVEEGDAS